MNTLREQFGQFEAEGTVFGAINKAQFEGLRFAGAPEELSRAFDSVVRPFDDRVEVNEAASVTLAALRDPLLPKLLSGEIRVRGAERVVESAV